jgi:hypothetical protein
MSTKTLIFTLLLLFACVGEHRGSEDARAWLLTFYPAATSIIVRCQQFDTDHNSYVSCTAKVDDKLIALECPSKDGCDCYNNTECRLANSNQAPRSPD